MAPGLWGFEHDLFMPGGLHFRGRTTVVQLPSGGLLLHSPNPIDDALARALEAIGPVEVLVAPNNLHHLHFGDAAKRWPEARRWAAPGLPDKRPDLTFHHVLTQDAPPWADVFAPHFIRGIPWMDESVFFHAATGTLVVTDLFFHFLEVANWQSRLFSRIYGVLGAPKQSPIVRFMAKDKPAAGASVHPLFALPVERLVPAHGPVIDQDAPHVLRTVLATQAGWARPAVEARSAPSS